MDITVNPGYTVAGMGIAGTHVTKADDIKAAVAAAFASGKPHLLEIEIEGKR